MQQNEPSSQWNQDWIEAERRRAAASRSYTTPAVITLVLYFVFWLPGLIANIVYLLDARKTEQLIGRAPEGKGCLAAMLAVFIAVPVAFFLLLLLSGVAAYFTAR